MKRLFQIAGLFSVLAFSSLAQSTTAQVNVPFSFQAGKSVMPAGKYLVHNAGGLLTLQNQDGKSVMYLTLPKSRPAISDYAKLEFTRYGNDYFLEAMWAANSHEGRALPRSEREKELISRSASFQTASITLNR